LAEKGRKEQISIKNTRWGADIRHSESFRERAANGAATDAGRLFGGAITAPARVRRFGAAAIIPNAGHSSVLVRETMSEQIPGAFFGEQNPTARRIEREVYLERNLWMNHSREKSFVEPKE
jgi:hypothetical protein